MLAGDRSVVSECCGAETVRVSINGGTWYECAACGAAL